MSRRPPLRGRFLAKSDPLQAIEWASKITDEPERYGTITLVAQTWYVRDEPTADAWIEASDLPDVYKRKSREIPPAMRRAAQRARERARERAAGEAAQREPSADAS